MLRFRCLWNTERHDGHMVPFSENRVPVQSRVLSLVSVPLPVVKKLVGSATRAPGEPVAGGTMNNCESRTKHTRNPSITSVLYPHGMCNALATCAQAIRRGSIIPNTSMGRTTPRFFTSSRHSLARGRYTGETCARSLDGRRQAMLYRSFSRARWQWCPTSMLGACVRRSIGTIIARPCQRSRGRETRRMG